MAKGRACFRYNRGGLAAHRASWVIHYGPIPPGMHVLHKCDNGLCVRPDHLFLGTHADNMRDMGDKGRARTPHVVGSQHAESKLTEADALQIRARYAKGGIRQVDLVVEFGVRQPTISALILRKTWTHI